MTEKEKQIEEMAKDLEQAIDWEMVTVGSFNNGSLIFAWDFDSRDTPLIVVAKKENDKIYAKIKETTSGVIVFDCYRKQSDTAREILQMIKDKGLLRYGGYLLHDSDFDTIGKLYGVEVEE